MNTFTKLALSILLTSCARTAVTEPPAPPERPPYQRSIVDLTRPKRAAGDVDVLDAPAVLAATYRVRPDRRFVNAAADVAEIARGKRFVEVEIDFEDGGWRVKVDGDDAVHLDAEPSFSSALAALTRWAAEERGSKASPAPVDMLTAADTEIAKFYPRYLYSALRRVDPADQKSLDAPRLARATRAATLLSIQAPGALDLADPLKGRALALLALARSADAACCREEQVMLAFALGYTSEAKALALQVPADSFARHYVEGSVANGPSTNPAEQWLELRRTLRETPLATWSKQPLFKGSFDSEAVSALLANDRFGRPGEIGSVVEALTNDALQGRIRTITLDGTSDWAMRAAGPEKEPSEQLKKFEALLPARASELATHLVDERAVRSFYEAEFMAGIDQQFNEWFERLGSDPTTRSFLGSLNPSSATGLQVVRWMNLLVAARYGRNESYRPVDALHSIPLLGGTAKQKLFDAQLRALGSTHADIRATARELYMVLDSRPAELWAAAMVADLPVGHLAQRERYASLAMQRARRELPCCEVANYLYQVGDGDGLRRLADDRTATIDERAAALGSLGKMTEEPLFRRMESLIAEAKYDPSWLQMYNEYANRRNRPDLKEKFARKVLAENPQIDEITRSWIIATIATAMEGQGRYAEAWKLVEPNIPVFSASILASGVSLLQRLGRNGEALDLGRRMVERYPTADTRADFARVLWRRRRHEEAAALFAPAAKANAFEDFRTYLPQAFTAELGDADPAEALRAFEALINAGLTPAMLRAFADQAIEEKRWKLAFALTDRYLSLQVPEQETMVQLGAYASAYRALKEMQGREAAMRWFLERMKKAPAFFLTIMMFNEREHEILGALAASGAPLGERPTESMALIGASLALQRVPLTDPRWSPVRTVFTTQRPGSDQVVEFAGMRYILGEGSLKDVAKLPTNSNDRCTASFFIGVKAVADRRMNDALTSFLADEEGPAGYGPCIWGISQIYGWREEMKRWEEIARR